MTLRVEIGEDEGWLDHLGNPMPKLVLSKEHKPESEYEAGHYPLESFGELYRSLDSIPERPVQKLTSWTISLLAGYSFRDSDGIYKSVPDLFYFLEALNEDKSKELGREIEFDIVGKAAVLYDDSKTIFKGMVESVASSGGKISISISERIGAPSIPKSEVPVLFGNSGEGAYVPVKIARNDLGIEEIAISQTTVELDGLYIYSEARDEYIRADFHDAEFDGRKIIFSAGAETARTDMANSSGGQFFVGHEVIKKLRPDASATKPDKYYVGHKFNKESVEAWTLGNFSDERPRQLGRSLVRADRFSHGVNEPIKAISKISNRSFSIAIMEDGAESLAESRITTRHPDLDDNQSQKEQIDICGNPSLFCNNLIKKGGMEYTEADFPYVKGNLMKHKARQRITGSESYIYFTVPEIYVDVDFSIKFRELDLPASAKVTSAQFLISLGYEESLSNSFETMPKYQTLSGIRDKDEGKISFVVDGFKSKELRLEESTSPEFYSLASASDEISFEQTQTATLNIYRSRVRIFIDRKESYSYALLALYGLSNLVRNAEDFSGFVKYTLRALRYLRFVRIPFADAKLYAKVSPITPPDSGSDSNGENSVVPAIKSLLDAAEAQGYEVEPEGDLPDIKYATFLQNESAKFRDKLGSLSAAASAIVRFDSVNDKFIVKSISRENGLEQAQIPLDAILLKNNFYDFKMETPERMDIHTGIEISWGKNSATGKYENKTFIDALGIYHNGKKTGKDTSGWTWLFDKLGKTKNAFNGANIKIIENEWIIDEAGAEGMAYNYLSWSCAPFRKAEIGCIKSQLPEEIGIGSLVYFNLPGYPEKLARTSWLVTAMTDDLDSGATSLQLLEMLGVEAVPEERFLLTEDRQPFLTEDTEEGIKLEA